MQSILGIDAGGTSVRACFLSEGITTTYTFGATPDGEPPVELKELILATTVGKTVVAACAGITKYTRAGVRESWEQFLYECCSDTSICVVPDYEIAFHAALPESDGVMVIAGTGSVAYGENVSSSQKLRVGGRGWEWGDEGSGAWLTTEMVRRTLRALDGMTSATTLTESVCAELGTTEPATLAAAARERAMQEGEGRGFLLPLLVELLHRSDTEARDLFVGAGGWLSALVSTTANRLEFAPDLPLKVATVGGVWKAGGEVLLEAFTNALRRRFPRASIRQGEILPVEGAIRLAAKSIILVDR